MPLILLRHRRAAAVLRGLAIAAALLFAGCTTVAERPAAPRSGTLRVATFNAALSGRVEGEIISRLASDTDAQAVAIGAILQRVRPDIVLINEFDYDPSGRSVQRFRERYLARPLYGGEPIDYPHHYTSVVNTGVPSGLDLDGDGNSTGPGDAWGFGRYPGQYGMLVLSRYPIREQSVRSFRNFRWADMPDALRPMRPDGAPFHPDVVWQAMRLSSKSHWDVPIDVDGRIVHVLAAHPTPPAFDGAEDRNGRRNHDEIRMWADYLSPERAGYLVDDAGGRGGLSADAAFVVVGDYNADPRDGNSVVGAIQQLLDHPRVDARFVPTSAGGALASPGSLSASSHTADFSEPTPGNLRVDYVLPSRQFEAVDGGVYWPVPGETGADWVGASDHRLVWLDLRRVD